MVGTEGSYEGKTISLPVSERIGNANTATGWTWCDYCTISTKYQPQSFPPFTSWTTYLDFDAFRGPVDALTCGSARATDIKVVGVP